MEVGSGSSSWMLEDFSRNCLILGANSQISQLFIYKLFKNIQLYNGIASHIVREYCPILLGRSYLSVAFYFALIILTFSGLSLVYHALCNFLHSKAINWSFSLIALTHAVFDNKNNPRGIKRREFLSFSSVSSEIS